MRSDSHPHHRPSFFRRRLLLVLGAIIMVLGGVRTQAGEAPRAKEDEVKAAFLYNFTKFVEWPAVAFAREDSPFVIGVFGRAALTSELEKAVRGRKFNGRPIVVKTLDAPADALTAHLVFIGSREPDVREICQRVDGHPVLVIGDNEATLRLGTAIAFLLENDKLRFSIRLDPATRGQLRISAQLQKLAKSVQEGD